MIETEQQRRWWFATHPDFSHGHDGEGSRGQRKEDEAEKVRPEEVDAYVDKMLKHADGPFADLLRSIKRNFGTGGETNRPDQRLAFLSETGSKFDDAASSQKEESEESETDLWHAIVQGIDDTFQDWERWLGFSLGLANPSRKLGQEMIKDHRPRPSSNHDAHHIVPAADKRFPEAEEARTILEKFKIDLSDSANGVWLPRKPGLSEGTHHPGVHTRAYYEKLEELLREAGNRDHAIEILKDIGQRLSKGTFPK